MARQAATVVQNSFIKGLITENTALNFPEDACTEAINCVFDETGRVSRRGGIDIESGFTQLANSGNVSTNCFTEYLWDQVAGLGTITFFVQQEGLDLKFFDVSSSSCVSELGLYATISLNSYTATTTPYSPADFNCQFAKGNGVLIVTNPAIDPIYVSYDPVTTALSATKITIRYRDFIGVEYTSATYTNGYRPVFADINTMKTDASSGNNGARHFYNILNQGWWQGNVSGGNPDSSSALGQWDTARTDMPSNSDRVESYRSSFTDSFDNARVGSFDQGNTLAPKGHFILDLGNADRQAALTAGGYSLSFSTDLDSVVSSGTGSVIGDFTGGSFAFDGSTTGSPAQSVSTADTLNFANTSGTKSFVTTTDRYIGKDYGGSPIRFVSATISNEVIAAPVSNGGIFPSSGSTSYGPGSVSGTITLRVYGSNSAPANATDGSLIGTSSRSLSGTMAFTSNVRNGTTRYTMGTNTAASKASTIVTSTDTAISYRYVWVRITTTCTRSFGSSGYTTSLNVSGANNPVQGTISSGHTDKIYEVTFTQRIAASGTANLPAADTTYERPSCVEWFASRVWYAGVSSAGLSNNLYFSQIIEKPEQYGRCYQLNDPTSESLRDILPTDGGIIKIAEIGKIYRLKTYQTALLVFASNGVWVVRGEGNLFTPTNFNVRKISSLGTQSPLSFVDVQGIPIWWGEDGILQIEYNPQFDSYSVNNLTDETIRRFFLEIPPIRRNEAKACYDTRDSIIYWLYNSDQSLNNNAYTKALCLNTLSGAFYPIEFYSATSILIKGILYTLDSIGNTDPIIKFTTTRIINETTCRLYYCDLKLEQFADYVNYAVETGDITDTGNYESSFITGYKTDGELLRFVQPNYVMVFLEQQEGASCYMRGIFDFTSNGNSGKWGSFQQIYNNTLENRNVNYKRLKVRGKGRSVQFQFRSDEDAPFTIIGWGAFETANSEV